MVSNNPIDRCGPFTSEEMMRFFRRAKILMNHADGSTLIRLAHEAAKEMQSRIKGEKADVNIALLFDDGRTVRALTNRGYKTARDVIAAGLPAICTIHHITPLRARKIWTTCKKACGL